MKNLVAATKSLFVKLLLRFSSFYLKNNFFQMGKQFYWDHVCVPYLSWRDTEIVCPAQFGQRMQVRPIDFIENRICFFGVYEPNVTTVFQSSVRTGDIVLDIGANIGYYTLLASKLVGPTGKVYAVEPSQINRLRLQHNLQLNNVTERDGSTLCRMG